jgi:transposase
MPAGRPPKGPRLVEGLDASEEAKRKLKVILETIAGDLSVSEACERLGVSESRFHQLRDEVLSAGASSMEPKPRGRPRKVEEPAVSDMEELKKENEELREELEFARARTVIATAFPHLVKDPADQKKTDPRKEKRKKRKAERKRKKKGS